MNGKGTAVVGGYGFPSNGDYREKSVRSVYEALEKDFEALESLLIAGLKI